MVSYAGNIPITGTLHEISPADYTHYLQNRIMGIGINIKAENSLIQALHT